MVQLKQLEASTGSYFPRGKFTVREATLLHKSLLSYLKGHGVTLEGFQSTLVHRNRLRTKNTLDPREMYIQLAMSLGTGRPVVAVYHYVRRKYHPNAHEKINKKSSDLENTQSPVKATHENDKNIEKENIRLSKEFNDASLTVAGAAPTTMRPDLVQRNRRSNWTMEEDEELKAAMAAHGNCWEKVGLALNITPMACLQRWRHLDPSGYYSASAKKYQSIKSEKFEWSPGFDFLLIQSLYDLNYEFELDIQWRQVHQQMLLQPSDEDIELKNRLAKFTPSYLRGRYLSLKKLAPKEIQHSIDDIIEFHLMRLQ